MSSFFIWCLTGRGRLSSQTEPSLRLRSHHRPCHHRRLLQRQGSRTSSLLSERNGGKKPSASASCHLHQQPRFRSPPPPHRRANDIINRSKRRWSSHVRRTGPRESRSMQTRTGWPIRSRRSSWKRRRERRTRRRNERIANENTSESANGNASYGNGRGPDRRSSCTSLPSRASAKGGCRMVSLSTLTLPRAGNMRLLGCSLSFRYRLNSPRKLSLGVPTRSGCRQGVPPRFRRGAETLSRCGTKRQSARRFFNTAAPGRTRVSLRADTSIRPRLRFASGASDEGRGST